MRINPTYTGAAAAKEAMPQCVKEGSAIGAKAAVIRCNDLLLFRLERSHEKYSHLLKKKDAEHIDPLVNYFVGRSGYVVFLGGEAVDNLYLRGKRKYKKINILAVLTESEADNYSSVMNNIISCNDGAFSLGMKYRVKKNRNAGFFKDLPGSKYVIEKRFESVEKLLYPFRPSEIELDLTTKEKFRSFYGAEIAN